MPRISHTLNWIRSWLSACPQAHTRHRLARRSATLDQRFDLEALEPRALLSGTPTLAPIADVTLLVGSPLLIPLNGADSELDPLSFSVSSSRLDILASIPQGNRSLKISVQDFGDMVFQLFEDKAPRVTDHIIELAETGFYDGIIFHRVIDGFVIQGGDPTGTGTGGSALGDFDDQFHPDLQHNRTGLLSMAKSTDDTNDSQFFITEHDDTEDPNSSANLRNLDFNHSVFGLLTVGESVRQTISEVAVNATTDRPLTDVVMNSVDVFFDDQNAVLMLKTAPDVTSDSADITVTVTNRDGLSTQQTFHVTIAADSGPTSDAQPFLDDIPILRTAVDSQITYQLVATDIDGTTPSFPTVFLDEASLNANSLFVPVVAHPNLDYGVNFNTGLVTITPTNGLKGVQRFTVATAQTADSLDYQVVTLIIGAPDLATPLADLNVNPNASPSTLDLTGRFTPTVAGDSVVLSVSDNSDPDLVSASFTGNVLTLTYAQGRVGSANITVRATSTTATPSATDAYLEDTFTVSVSNPSVQINFDDFTLLSYANQDDEPAAAAVLHNGTQLELTGDTWKRIPLGYNITASTILEFDFRSLAQGDFQAIGFDSDNDPANDQTALFLLRGSQASAGWPQAFDDFLDYESTAPAPKHYLIHLGQFLTGPVEFLTFINDDDTSPQDAQSTFANIQIYDVLNFTSLTVDPYVAEQDTAAAQATVEESGAQLRITGNAWKHVPFSYTLTPDTVLEFDFQSTTQGELQGIGFDSDTDQFNSGSIAFLLYGTQDPGDWTRAVTDFRNYSSTAPASQHYTIPIGQYFNGEVSFLTFINDDDASPQDAQSVFAHIRVYENLLPGTITFDELTVTPYVASQDAPNTFATTPSFDRALRIGGNAWKQVPLDYTITADTVLEFDFESTSQGELQGIGFDTDGDQFNAGSIVFLLYGTQDNSGWNRAVTDFRDYSQSAPSTRHYRIPVGQYITGDFTALTFVNDDDDSQQNVLSIYSNVRIYEAHPPDVLNFTSLTVNPYVAAQDAPVGTQTAAQGTSGRHLRISGNAWKQVAFSYTITADTVLEFDYLSPIQGELQGIGFDSDNDQTNENSIAFLLYGTQDPGDWTRTNADFRDYASTAPAWKHYRIPVGQFMTGSVTFLTFINDHDTNPQDAQSLFANIEIFEDL